jgi:hypothetical protein
MRKASSRGKYFLLQWLNGFRRRGDAKLCIRQKASTSYAEAAASCKAKVDAIIHECRRLNQKYYDRMFNLPDWDALVSLGAESEPKSVGDLQGVGACNRIEDIFEDPQFFEDGATASDIKQGTIGDCWILAALTALSGKKDLIESLCVARDEKVGVYGFVFFRGKTHSSAICDFSLTTQQMASGFLKLSMTGCA